MPIEEIIVSKTEPSLPKITLDDTAVVQLDSATHTERAAIRAQEVWRQSVYAQNLKKALSRKITAVKANYQSKLDLLSLPTLPKPPDFSVPSVSSSSNININNPLNLIPEGIITIEQNPLERIDKNILQMGDYNLAKADADINKYSSGTNESQAKIEYIDSKEQT